MLVAAGFLALLAIHTPAAADALPRQLASLTVDQSLYSGLTERRTYVITDSRRWAAFWATAYAETAVLPPLPEIDFAWEMVIAVALGQQTTGGHAVTVEQVLLVGDTVQVLVSETAPAGDCIVPQALTQPYHIVRVPRVEMARVELISHTSDGCR
jgi:hypothetical protein